MVEEEEEQKYDEGRRKRRTGLSADIPVAVLSIPAEGERPGGGHGIKGGDARPPCGEGGHDILLPSGSLPSCLFPLQFLLWGSSYKEEVKQAHRKDAQGTKQESLCPASFMHLPLSFTCKTCGKAFWRRDTSRGTRSSATTPPCPYP